jgi:hypothetical protein
VSTGKAELPYYAARSLLRTFAALALSIVFTFVYAAAAARLRRAEKVLLHLLHPAVGGDPRVLAAKRPGSPAATWCGCPGLSLREAKTILAYTTTNGNKGPPAP